MTISSVVENVEAKHSGIANRSIIQIQPFWRRVYQKIFRLRMYKPFSQVNSVLGACRNEALGAYRGMGENCSL